jgi:hypothetical protein
MLDDLLAGYTAPVRIAFAAPTPAKAANSANREHPCGFAAHSGAANGLRISANPAQTEADDAPDSQEFAAVRRPQTGPQSKDSCGSSQDSQDSQGCPQQRAAAEAPDLSGVAWTDADIARFLDRRARLMRWGWAEREAEALAERLVKRDRDGDDRRMCVECSNLGERGRCMAAAAGKLPGADRRLEPVPTILQRCEAFGLRTGQP